MSVGDLVLIAEDNEAPIHWKLARITKLFKGNDNVSRVAELKTATKILNRPVIKLRKLPVDAAVDALIVIHHLRKEKYRNFNLYRRLIQKSAPHTNL